MPQMMNDWLNCSSQLKLHLNLEIPHIIVHTDLDFNPHTWLFLSSHSPLPMQCFIQGVVNGISPSSNFLKNESYSYATSLLCSSTPPTLKVPHGTTPTQSLNLCIFKYTLHMTPQLHMARHKTWTKHQCVGVVKYQLAGTYETSCGPSFC